MTGEQPPRSRAESDLLTQERYARAAWSRIAEPGDTTARSAISRGGAVAALQRVLDGDRDLARFQPRADRLDVARDLQVAERFGARVVVPGDEEWPGGVDDLASPPYCLWVRGPLRLGAACERSVAIVGARSATAYGEAVAADIAAGVADRGFAVVSGAAFGIDAAAHRGALAVDGRTVAVLAGGVERPYPAAHTALLSRIADSGAVVSEVAPGSAPTRNRFLQRNRLIATLAGGTVVVEAGLRSGSLNTAGHALKAGRVVGAVPGPVTSMMSAGCHEWIRGARAVLVTDAAEVADAVGAIGEDLAPHRSGPVLAGDGLDEVPARVLDALPPSRGVGLDRLSLAAGLTVAEVQSALGLLELRGLAERHGEGWRKSRRTGDRR
ncbi:MAG TPA: DNA-processing protein DprA [Segeticoccus sp.]|nr:DNA-processing protein DprA [Segeticoccus sp.]